MVFVPAMTLIRYYFSKYQSRASIIPWCGGGVASIIAPFVIRAVRKEYGVSGTYFIMAAMELHICLAGLLLRPISAYKSVNILVLVLVLIVVLVHKLVHQSNVLTFVKEGANKRVQHNTSSEQCLKYLPTLKYLTEIGTSLLRLQIHF
jgi:hypothetical protein